MSSGNPQPVHSIALGGEVVAIDSAFFHGDAAKASITTRKRLAERLAAVEREVAAYEAAVAEADAADAAQAGAAQADAAAQEAGAARLKALLARRAAVRADLAGLDESGGTQVSRTDPDARLLTKGGTTLAGYNAQIAVDGKHKLVVASEVVTDGNDTGQLHAMALAAKQALGAQGLQVAADSGYYNGETIRACEADGIEPFVPEPARGAQASAEGRFGLDRFSYDPVSDTYRCPTDQALKPWPGRKTDVTGKRRIRYASSKTACRACPLRAQCLGAKAGGAKAGGAKARRRVIERWEHEEVIERHRARMAQPSMAQPSMAQPSTGQDSTGQDSPTPGGPDPSSTPLRHETRGEQMMRRRKALAEHPFGTLKCRAGYRHFLVRGLDKVRGEWGLMVLCHNLARVLAIVGLDRVRAYLDHRRRFWPHLTPTGAPWTLLDRIRSLLNRLTPRPAHRRARQTSLAA